MPLKILIVGAGVCGPALAFFLQRADTRHSITVIERFALLRTAGQQIDVKDQGVHILRKMGLLDAMKSHRVNKTGLEIVDNNGKQMALFGVNPSGEQRPTLTAEYEIMRYDAVKMFYDASLDQDARSKETGSDKGAEVTFSNGQRQRFDLVVGADGQGSRVRRLAFGREASDSALQSFGVHGAYYSIPRVEGERDLAKAYSASRSQLIFTRNGNRPVTQVLLFTRQDTEKLKESYKKSIEEQKRVFVESFQDAGWQAERRLKGLDHCDDFYSQEVGQIKLKQLHKDRFALVGDAGYGPSPFTDMGTTASLVGAYVLAGELARHDNDVAGALRAYDNIMRPHIDEYQKMPAAALNAVFPSSQIGVWVLRNVLWAVSKIDQFTYRPRSEDNCKFKLPDYTELKLAP